MASKQEPQPAGKLPRTSRTVAAKADGHVAGVDRASVADHLDDRPVLLPSHERLIEASGISADVARARGYRSVAVRADLKRLGFSDRQCRVPALLIPIMGVTGEVVTYQARPDEPRVTPNGKAVKYETPKGSSMALDVPPGSRRDLANPDVPLFVTEGARKADAGVSAGLCTIALLGVWNWRGTNAAGGKTALPDWESIALNDRTVYIVFDSDVMTKPGVYAALGRLVSLLRSRKAKVFVIYLPAGDGGEKVGLDDFLAAGRSPEDLLHLATRDLRAPEGSLACEYERTPDGMFWNKPTADGHVPVRLANFGARITAEEIEDDGVETRRQLRVSVHLGESQREVVVPSRLFAGMNWVVEQVGATAIVEPGLGIRDRLRVATQRLSGDVPSRTVYVHMGWTRGPDGKWVYLHAGGAIGEKGPVLEVETALPTPLHLYSLSMPPSGGRCAECWASIQELLGLASPRVMFTLLAAACRSVLGDTDFTLHLVGPSGTFKTETAALVQAFWGAGLDARHLPGSWSSTGNSLEALAFAAKDAVLVVDDFAPSGSSNDIQRYHREADRILRAQGNRSGRGRLRPDGTLVPARPPRGLILSTGEDIPSGHSLRARMLVVEFGPGDVCTDVLTKSQKAAAGGSYAEFLAGFVQWIAPQFESVRKRVQERAVELRLHRTGRHARTAAITAELQAGFELLLEYVASSTAASEQEVEELRGACWKAVNETATRQADTIQSAEPTEVFVRLLTAALAAGQAHLAGLDGDSPPADVAAAVGWRGSLPLGLRVGWIHGKDVYLQPDSAHKAAQSMGSETDRLAVAARTLTKRMSEQGLLASEDKERGKHGVRRVIQGQRRTVLHLNATVLGFRAQQSHEAHAFSLDARDDARGPETGAQNRVQQMRSGPRLGPAGTPREGGDGDPGPDGPDGPGTSTTVPIADAVAGNGRPFEAAALESSGAQPHRDRPCRMCGGKKLWRLLPGSGRPDGGDLFCVSCQAPGPPADQIEFVEVAGA